jgi:hypothetical protein
MKEGDKIVLKKGSPVRIGRWWNYIEYEGTNEGNYVFFFDDCKISIPLERAKHFEINKYQFEFKEASQESISLKYLGPKKIEPKPKKHL